MMRHNYKNLRIWQNGMDLVDLVYNYVESFPSTEKYNLINQSIRAACSVPANIAEGSAKNSDRDFRRFLEMSLGSCYELETHLTIAQRRKYGDGHILDKVFQALDEEQKMLYGMIKSLTEKITKN